MDAHRTQDPGRQQRLSDSAVNRRGFLAGGGAAGFLALAGCGSATGNDNRPSGEQGSWTFTDDRGKTAREPQRPTRIVAHVASAAALWDLGIHPIGVFGALTRADGTTVPRAGDIDPEKVTSVGVDYAEFNLDTFASLRPDLVVANAYGEGDELYYLPKTVLDKVRKLTPVVGIQLAGMSLPEPIGRYHDLAKALGADLDTPSITQAKQRFEQASAKVESAASKRPDLKIMAVSGSPDSMYVVRPGGFPGLSHLADLGCDLQKGSGSSISFEQVSWEQADRYPADVILYDTRTQWYSLKQLKKQPTFARLPAVRTGQVIPWPIDTRCTYEGWAPALERVATGISKAHTVV